MKRFRGIYPFAIVLALAAISNASEIRTTQAVWDDEVWKDIPGQNFVRFYIFNVTNAAQYDLTNSPEKPIVKEVGPYVYRLKREKIDRSQVLEDGSYFFREKRTFEFQPVLSDGRSEDDLVNVVNAALLTYATRGVINAGYSFAIPFGYLMSAGEELVLKGQRIGDILFDGRNASIYVHYEKDVATDEMGFKPPGFEAFEDGRFGLLKGANGSRTGLLRAKPRSAGNSDVGQIISWNEEAILKFWGGDACNEIAGTDGSLFGSDLIESKSDIRVFLPEIGRSAPLTYKESTEYGGVAGNRYRFPDSFLEDVEIRPENQCFCTDRHNRCLRRGALDMEAAKSGAPYVLTHPHFLKADGIYSHRVEGLIPAPTIHESFYDIEPKTGTVLRSKNRFQWNLRLGQIAGESVNLTYFRNIPDYIFPLYWAEESFELDGDILAELKSHLAKDDESPPGEGTTEVPIIVPTTTTASPTTTASESTKTTTVSPTTASTTTIAPTSPGHVTQQLDQRWMSNKFDSINAHLIFVTFLLGCCVMIGAVCIALLITNVRATAGLLRSATRDSEVRSRVFAQLNDSPPILFEKS